MLLFHRLETECVGTQRCGAKNPHPQLSRAARLTRHHLERTVGAIELGNGLRWLEAMGCGNGHPLTGQQRPLATG